MEFSLPVNWWKFNKINVDKLKDLIDNVLVNISISVNEFFKIIKVNSFLIISDIKWRDLIDVEIKLSETFQ